MKLQDFLGKDTKFGMDAIAADIDLAKQVQIRLVALGLLDPPANGQFGPISSASLKRFQDLVQCGEPGFLGQITAKKLIETKAEDLPKPPIDLSKNDLAARIIKYLQAKSYYFATGNSEYNILYVEGMDADGTLNGDEPNEFNDRRMVLEFVNGIPKIVGSWEATTEPGSHYTYHPMNPDKGAARIKFGQYKAWRMGMHGAVPHRALIQVAPISVHRDFNQDFSRVGDFVETGLFEVDQHWGYDYPRNDIAYASAGCLVGRTTQGHQEFLDIIEQDRRYLATPVGAPVYPGDPNERTYVFASTIIPGDELVKMFPA